MLLKMAVWVISVTSPSSSMRVTVQAVDSHSVTAGRCPRAAVIWNLAREMKYAGSWK